VRHGCHCAHLLVKHLVNINPLLERFQGLMLTLLPKLSLPGVVRVSLGIGNSEEDVNSLIEVLDEIARQPRTLPNTDIQKQMNDFIRVATQKVYSQRR
jgi:selenocysteine lyase/cysteine desulfurase